MDLREALAFGPAEALASSELDSALETPAETEVLVKFAPEAGSSDDPGAAPDACLGEPVWLAAAKNGGAAPAGETGSTGDAGLAAGRYVFCQLPGPVDRAALAAAAGELQREGLWRRLGLGEALYLRVLTEDGRRVFQLWRAVEAD